jgi:Uncharacterized protein conserved in bacteria
MRCDSVRGFHPNDCLVVRGNFTEGKQVPPTTQKLGVGNFVWEPERSPGGPVLIVVSVPEQVAYVYRNGIRIARTSVSTGRPGHPTQLAYSIFWKTKKITSQRSTKAPRCRGWSD